MHRLLFISLPLFGLLPGFPTGARAQEAVPQVAVAARDLPRGVTLAPEDIRWSAAPPTDRAGGAEAEVGWTTRRVIREGEPLRTPAVAPPDVVAAGQPVQVVWSDGVVRVRVRGTAVGSAALGERVLVKINPRRRLEGIAAGPALVHLSSFNESGVR